LKTVNYFYAKYRAFAWLSCFDSPNPNLLRGWKRWQWLARQRKMGRLVEPSVRIHGNLGSLEQRLVLGKDTHLDHGVIVWLGDEWGSIQLAERVYVGPYTFLGTNNHKLQIGEDSMIGAHSYIITENHGARRTDVPFKQQNYTGADVAVGRNVWLGCHVTILPGVAIGDHAIIGAGAVVTKNVPADETWAGVPAKKIGQRDDKAGNSNP
jgi:acetyltransferase-like isoleucine patch superfamily enzyme